MLPERFPETYALDGGSGYKPEGAACRLGSPVRGGTAAALEDPVCASGDGRGAQAK